MEKLPRLKPKNGYFPGPYTTGDSQEWTYEYTWEDLLATFDNDSSSESSMENIISCNIRKYFKEHPEKVQNVECFRNLNLTISDSKSHCGLPVL